MGQSMLVSVAVTKDTHKSCKILAHRVHLTVQPVCIPQLCSPMELGQCQGSVDQGPKYARQWDPPILQSGPAVVEEQRTPGAHSLEIKASNGKRFKHHAQSSIFVMLVWGLICSCSQVPLSLPLFLILTGLLCFLIIYYRKHILLYSQIVMVNFDYQQDKIYNGNTLLVCVQKGVSRKVCISSGYPP